MLAPDDKERQRTEHAQRIAAAQAELKKDPARSDRTISKLVGVSKASMYRLRAEMEGIGAIKMVPPGQRVTVTGEARKYAKPGELAGPRIKVPDGSSITEMIHVGFKLEKEGKSVRDAAYLSGMGAESYRQAGAIVQLAERDDLAPAERAIAERALAIMNKERRTRHAFALVRELSSRVWGNGQRARTDKTVERLIENFMNAISVITIACDKGRELEIPQLSASDATSVILQLRDAVQSLKELRSNLNRRIQ